MNEKLFYYYGNGKIPKSLLRQEVEVKPHVILSDEVYEEHVCKLTDDIRP